MAAKIFAKRTNRATGKWCSLCAQCDSYVGARKLMGDVFSLRSVLKCYEQDKSIVESDVRQLPISKDENNE